MSNRLNEDQVRGIAADLKKKDYDVAKIAKRWKKSVVTVYSILNGQTWAHVTGAPDVFKFRRTRDTKLTPGKARSVVKMVNSQGKTQKEAGDAVGISQSAVSRIVRGKMYADATGVVA